MLLCRILLLIIVFDYVNDLIRNYFGIQFQPKNIGVNTIEVNFKFRFKIAIKTFVIVSWLTQKTIIRKY